MTGVGFSGRHGVGFRISDFGFTDRTPGELADGAEEAGGVEVLDVALAAVQLVDLHGVGVEAEDAEALLGEGEGERQADVAEADDADERASVFDLLVQLSRVVALVHGQPSER
jgi:hypothetical protein